jgi:6 kDa early secretory antigenic target
MIGMNFAEMAFAAERIKTASDNMNVSLDGLKTAVAAVVMGEGEGTAWSGAAQEEYRARQVEWDDAAAQLNALLMRLSSSVTASQEMMQTTEHTITRRWGSPRGPQ